MSIIKKGTDFGATEQVTSTKLDNLVDNASFTDTSANAVAYTGSTGTCLNGGGLEVTSAGQLQIKDSDISTAKIADDAVTQAKTSFINDTTGAMTLSGTEPQITFNDDDNPGTSPRINANSTNGNISILAEQSGADILIDADDNVILRNNGSNILATSDTVAKDAGGNAASGAQITGSLEVTQDIFCSGGFNDIILKSSSPKITFEETDVSIGDPHIQSFNSGNLEIKTEEANSLIELDGKKGLIVKYDGTNTLIEADATAATDAGGNANQSGVKITGDLEVTSDIYVAGDGRITNNSDPKLTFADTRNSGAQPFVQSYDTGSIQMRSDATGSNVILDGKSQTILQYNDTSIFRVGSDVAKNESGSDVEGAQVTGSLEVTDHLYVTNAARLGTNSILQASPSTSDDSTKIASTAYVADKIPAMFTMIDDGGNTESSMASDTESVTLPNGLIMKFGTNNANGDGNTTVNFATDFPNACLNVQCTHAHSFNTSQDAGLGATSLSVGSFVIRNGLGAGGNVFWFAIGF